MAVHEIDSEEWTGGEAPPLQKTRFDLWTDRHPNITIVSCTVLLALFGAGDVRDPSWTHYWIRVVNGGFYYALNTAIIFGAQFVIYLFLKKSSTADHLTMFQNRYILGMVLFGLFASVLIVPWLSSRGYLLLVGYP